MPSAIVRQQTFRGGEVSPEFYGHTHDPRYGTALRTCKNFLPIVHGALVNRAGTRDLGAVRSSIARFFEFVFSDLQALILEVTDQRIRFWTASGLVVDGGGNPVEVITPYVAGDLQHLDLFQSGDVVTITHRGYQTRELTRFSNTTWTLSLVTLTPQAYFGGALSLQNFYLIPGNGIVGPLYDNAHAYALNDLVSFVDAAGNVGQWISLQNANTGHAPETNPDWWVRHSWASPVGPQPAYKKGDYVFYKGILYFSLADGNLNQQPDTAVAYWVRADDATRPAVTANWAVTQVWRDANGIITETLPSAVLVSPYGGKFPRYTDRPGTLSWGLPVVGAGPASYKLIGHNVYCGDKELLGLIGATEGNTTTFQDKGAAPNFGIQPPKGTNPFKIADGANTDNTVRWPGAGTFHEQRRVLAGTSAKPSTFFGSEVGNIQSHDVNEPAQDSDAYEWRLSSQKLEDIRSLRSFGRLCLFTGQGEFSAQGKDGGAITPTSVEVRRHSSHGSSYLRPLEVEHALIFNTAKGNYLRDLYFDYNSNAFVGSQLCEFVRHFFRGYTIKAWAHQRVPHHLIWIVRSDGALFSMTYDRATQTVAFAQHPTSGTVQEVACIPDGTEDVLMLCVDRGLGPRMEKMASRDLITDQRLAWFLDAALSFDGRNTGATTMRVTGASFNAGDLVTIDASVASFAGTDVNDQVVLAPNGRTVLNVDDTVNRVLTAVRATVTAFVTATQVTARLEAPLDPLYQNAATTDWGFARDTLTGLAHLEGKDVNVLADGIPQGPFTVVAGEIGALAPPALIAIAGLSYNSDAELLDLAADSVKSNVKSIEKVILEVVGSRGISAGEDFDNLTPAILREVEEDSESIEPVTGQVDVAIESSWNTGGRACIRQSDPLPLTIVAAMREVEVGGR